MPINAATTPATPAPTNELFPRAVPRDPATGQCPAGSDQIVSHVGTACVPKQTPQAALLSTAAVAGMVAAPIAAGGLVEATGVDSLAAAGGWVKKVGSTFGKDLGEEFREMHPSLSNPEAVGHALAKGTADGLRNAGMLGFGAAVGAGVEHVVKSGWTALSELAKPHDEH